MAAISMTIVVVAPIQTGSAEAVLVAAYFVMSVGLNFLPKIFVTGL